MLSGHAPDLLPRSQDVDLVVSAINIPPPDKPSFPQCARIPRSALWGSCSSTSLLSSRETFDMEIGAILASEFFYPVKGQSVGLCTPSLPECSPLLVDSRSSRSVFWCSEVEPVP